MLLLLASQNLSTVSNRTTVVLGVTNPISDGRFGPFSIGAKIPSGIGPDAILSVSVTSTSIDLTTVTTATLTAIDGALAQHLPWTATVAPASGSSVVLPSAAFLNYSPLVTDVTTLGRWRLEIQLQFSGGGRMPCAPIYFDVVDPWGRR